MLVHSRHSLISLVQTEQRAGPGWDATGAQVHDRS